MGTHDFSSMTPEDLIPRTIKELSTRKNVYYMRKYINGGTVFYKNGDY